ncbi:hypothetical protein PC129_g17142 [Phytophthora cactorum]|uniref:Uncharacterized protein n=1 Tax=Phytophthora cactorum TaxID=29920 RepID=A0A8T0Z949_9STRA|nr:hypothetical protein Pcac1_g5656 [Phytophthora cactorum]KAG2816251.1 hypothetical protein PC111_g13222 [Phytophthora cactorum]KAG2826675.1 hypothetical protein PC112_g9178 [Phytophthora cactorum]KAG2858378.1 hypothetical protein PC113_g9866 [Phytophthora cactorum]KAG2884455.1 hypothetical protein PC114_g20080 [Phytophthora cactorum]
MKSAQAKKTRKPSAAQVAKEKGERRAAAELLCGASADAEERDAVALEETRKKLEAISATKARKRQKTTVAMPTQVSPTSMMSCQHVCVAIRTVKRAQQNLQPRCKYLHHKILLQFRRLHQIQPYLLLRQNKTGT